MSEIPYQIPELIYDVSRAFYPNIFFDPLYLKVPDIKRLFRWIEFFSATDGFLSTIISKMAIYPVTEVIVTPEDKTSRNFLEILNDKDINTILIMSAIHYLMYGFVGVSVLPGFTRYLVCKKCSGELPMDKVPNFEFVEYKFKGDCPKCGSKRIEFSVRDVIKSSPENAIIKIWNPNDIEIDDTEFGEDRYFYRIPKRFLQKIGVEPGGAFLSYGVDVTLSTKSPDEAKKIVNQYLMTVPYVIIQAAKEKKSIIFKKDFIFTRLRPGPFAWQSKWGMPLPYRSLKDIFTYYALRKTLDMLVIERTIPYRFIFPMPTAAGDPAQFINYSRLKSEIAEAMVTWKRFPNALKFLPIPIELKLIGNESMTMDIPGLLNYLEKRIVRECEVPLEFVEGSMSWSGASISLRMLENQFKNITFLFRGLLKFIKDRIATIYELGDLSKYTYDLTDMRMADDIPRQTLYMNLAQNNKISWTTALNEFGIDFSSEIDTMISDMDKIKKLNISMLRSDAEAQIESQKILGTTPIYVDLMRNLAMAESPLTKEEFMSLPPFIIEMIAKMNTLKESERNMYMEYMKEKMPNFYKLAKKVFDKIGVQKTTAEGQQGEILPEQKPPRRGEESKIV